MDINNIPKSFCVLPWMHTAIEPNGSVRSCCISEYNSRLGNLNETPMLKDIFNNNNYINLRKRLLTDDSLPPECYKCKIVEDAGMSSYRIRSNRKYKDFIETLEPNPSGEAEFKQLYIDYRFSNKCNFKCITCGPSLSSSHAVEFRKLAINDTPALIEVDSKSFFEQFKTFSSDIREIYFAGGEPLINDHHYDILNHFIETQQPVSIYYNTNFSNLNYQTYDLLDMWSKINGPVDLFISIDGIGEAGEMIRSGLDLEQFAKNVHKVKNSGLRNVRMHFSITYGLTNYRDVIKTAQWLDNLSGHDKNVSIGYNPIMHRTAFSILSMTPQQIENAICIVNAQLNEWSELDQSDDVIQHRITTAKESFLKFIEGAVENRYENSVILDDVQKAIAYMNSRDPLRKINWKETLSDMYNDWLEILKTKDADE